jgi:hypothetical protein
MATAFDNTQQRCTIAKRSAAKPRQPVQEVVALVFAALMTAAPIPTYAVDGCLVLLCLAAPSWRNVPQCVDPVRQVLRDLAHGHPFPTCSSAGTSTVASNRAAEAPTFCPPQYTVTIMLDSGPSYICRYSGAIEARVDGALWSRTWWSLEGDSVTEYTDAAKLGLGTWDTRFDIDYAAWLASRPAPELAPPESGS